MDERASKATDTRHDRTSTSQPWPLPPEPCRQDGRPRRVGIEIEFAGLSVAETTRLLKREWNATIYVRSRHDMLADVPSLGEAEVALDTRHAKHLPQDSGLTASVRDVVGDAASLVVPTEITAPPIELEHAAILDDMVAALREAGAEGTRASPTNAFAMQLNVEASSTAPSAVLAVLRSFLLLEDWLRHEIDVDVARNVLGFEHRYPAEYQCKVLAPDYQPSAAVFIDDYVTANPTRNRALDLLPILADIDADRVRAALLSEKIKPRPAYHYRLPDCRIGRPGWCPRDEWQRWLSVERLAADPDRLERAMRKRRNLLDGYLPQVLSGRAIAEDSIVLGRTL